MRTEGTIAASILQISLLRLVLAQRISIIKGNNINKYIKEKNSSSSNCWTVLENLNNSATIKANVNPNIINQNHIFSLFIVMILPFMRVNSIWGLVNFVEFGYQKKQNQSK